jgi:hypothetical protein
MKLRAVLFLLAAAIAILNLQDVAAQTNRAGAPRPVAIPANPGLGQLTLVTNRIAWLEKKIESIHAAYMESLGHLELQKKAGKMNERDYGHASIALGRKANAEQAPLEKELAARRLQEYEIRKTFKLPKESPKSDRRR